MKAPVRQLISTAVLGLALFSNSTPSWAGYKSTPEVVIIGDTASGSMAGARYSGDSQQYIACQISGNSNFVTCIARNKTGRYLVCTGNDSKWRSVVKAITDFSQIYFGLGPPDTALCGGLHVDNFSYQLR